jgi:hypothetical protein
MTGSRCEVKKLLIKTHDSKGVLTRTENEPTPGKKVKLDEAVGSTVMNRLIEAKRANPKMTATEMEALRGELVAEAERNG